MSTADPDTRSSDVSKHTFQPNTRKRAKTHGFRLRMRTRSGRAILAVRCRTGRGVLSACAATTVLARGPRLLLPAEFW